MAVSLDKRVQELMENGHTDGIIQDFLSLRMEGVTVDEIKESIARCRGVFSMSRTVKGKKRPITKEQLGRVEKYYSTFSNTSLTAKGEGEFVVIEGSEIGVLRLFGQFSLTLKNATWGKRGSTWFFKFEN